METISGEELNKRLVQAIESQMKEDGYESWGTNKAWYIKIFNKVLQGKIIFDKAKLQEEKKKVEDILASDLMDFDVVNRGKEAAKGRWEGELTVFKEVLGDE